MTNRASSLLSNVAIRSNLGRSDARRRAPRRSRVTELHCETARSLPFSHSSEFGPDIQFLRSLKREYGTVRVRGIEKPDIPAILRRDTKESNDLSANLNIPRNEWTATRLYASDSDCTDCEWECRAWENVVLEIQPIASKIALNQGRIKRLFYNITYNVQAERAWKKNACSLN